MRELYGIIGLHLSKVKSDINKYGEFDYYSIVGCKVISILSGDTFDISAEELVTGLCENKIIDTDHRLYYADRARIRIKRGLVQKLVFIYDHLKDRGGILYNLYVDGEVIYKPYTNLVSLLSDLSICGIINLIYDYSEEKLFLSVVINYEFDCLRYYYLDSTYKYLEYKQAGNSYANNNCKLYDIDVKELFNCCERYSNGTNRVNNYYFIGSSSSGDVIIPNGCTDLILGRITASEVKTLVIPPSISSVIYNRSPVSDLKLYLSKELPYKLKCDICNMIFGLNGEFDSDFEKVRGVTLY